MVNFTAGRRPRALLAVLAILGTPSILAACGSSSSGSATRPEKATAENIGVRLDEYSIKLDRTAVPSGNIVFKISNSGAMKHEFVVIPTDLAADALPVSKNEVEEAEVLGNKHPQEAEDIGTGTSTTLKVNLAPGHYVFICNLPGHYHGGMRAALTVTKPGEREAASGG